MIGKPNRKEGRKEERKKASKKERMYLKDKDLDGRIILKWFFSA